MSQLIAIVYSSPEIAREAATRMRDAATGYTITLRDLVIATRDTDGKVKLDQSVNLTSGAVLGGACWGGLLGMLFMAPLAGMVGGAAIGAVGSLAVDYGIDDKFMKRLSQQVVPGKAVLFLLTDDMVVEKVAKALHPFGGELLYSSLASDADKVIRDAVERPVPTLETRP